MHTSIRNKLVDFNPDLSPYGDVAESWDVSPDAKVWTFKIRKDIEFHNGKTLDVNDVVYSIRIHVAEDSGSPARGILAGLDEVRADGPEHVVFKLKEGSADFVALLGDAHLQMTPDGTTDWANAPGTGPFVLDSFEPGVRFFANRNPNYFHEGKPYFDELEILSINDLPAKTNAVKTGQVDIIDHPDPKTLHLLGQDPSLKIIQLQGLRHFVIPMNTTVAPYDNNDVRLGLKYAVDRESIVKTLLRGHGSVGNDQSISPVNRYFDKSLEQRVYDADKAKWHMKQAGVEGHTFELHASPGAFAESVDMAVLIQETAARAGIKIDVKRVPADGYWSDIWMKKDWCFSYWSGRTTEDWMFSQAYSKESSWNESHWKNAQFNRLLKAARVELDDAKRRGMYADMQRLVRDEGGTIVPAFQDQIMAAAKNLSFEEPLAKHRAWDGNKMAERWWFA